MGILEEYAARSAARPGNIGAPGRSPELRVWRKLMVDSFCGGGGVTTGMELALGRGPDIAINHDETAIAMHRKNHPNTTHLREDVWRVDPAKVTGGQPVGLLWLSPDCTHFSGARGGKPVDQKIRGLAWMAVHWARKCRPDVIILENVKEFEGWGPTIEARSKAGNIRRDAQGVALRMPDPKRKGQTFRQWRRKLEALGYTIEWRKLKAHEYGAPTTRERLFLIARCDGLDIVWPDPTHGEGLKPVRSAGSVIDFTLPTRSIFGRKKDLADQTLARIAHGIPRHLKNGPFLVRHGHARTKDAKGKPLTDVRVGKDGLTFRGQADIRKPLGVVCGTNDKGLVVPMLRPVGTRGAGTSEPLVAAWIQKNNGGARGGAIGSSLHGPMHTITGTCQQSLVVAFLDKFNGNGGTQGIDEPMHTITGSARFGLVTLEIDGTTYEITDIHYRMLAPKELYAAQGFPDDYIFEFEHEGKPLTQEQQIKKAGNSVCPDVAAALVEANAPEGITTAA